MVLTIKNFESQNVGPGVVETAPTGLATYTIGGKQIGVKWTSATGESGVTWTEEKLVRKEGSAPEGSMDGTVVTTITTKDQHKTTGYLNTGLSESTTYYYKVFAIYDNGTERGSDPITVTTKAYPVLQPAITTANGNVTLKWTDPVDAGSVTWTKSILVRKEGNSSPTSPTDGVQVVTNTIRNQYQSTGYVDTGCTVGTEYTYKVFSYYSDVTGWSTASGATKIIAGIVTESVAIVMKADSSGNLMLPIQGSYNWEIIIDGEAPITKSGTGSSSQKTMVIKSGLTAGSEHLIVINPVVEEYGWAKAFSFGTTGIANLLVNIIYDGSYKGYASSATETGDGFRYRQYRGCVLITSAPAEVLPNTVTSIGYGFRDGQYLGCSALTTAPAEVLPNTVTSIGAKFRAQQYSGTAITTAPDEVMSNITSIPYLFRAQQYEGCQSLRTTGTEKLPTTVTSIDYSFRYCQFQGCTGLRTVKRMEAKPTAVSKGSEYRADFLYNAGNSTNRMTINIYGDVVETGYNNSLRLTNANVYQIKVKSSLVSSYQSSGSWSSITDSKFVAI